MTRGLALLGMIAVHALIPYDENLQPNWVSYVATGHASAVFAVLAGVGLSMTTGRAQVPLVKALPTAAAVGGRAAAIAAVGFTLGYADAEITGVILPYYAVLFLLAIPLLFLRTRTLLVVGVFAAVAVPVLSQFVRPALPVSALENLTLTYLSSDPLGLLSELLVTGAYPAIPWMAYICTGLIVGRLTLSSVKVARRLLIFGAALAITAGVAARLLLGPLGGRAALELAGPGLLNGGDADSVNDLLAFGFDGTTPTTSWWWLATGAPHAGTPLDLLGTIGSAVALLGAVLLLGHLVQPTLRRIIDGVMAPLAAAGGMTLTLYAAHIVFMNSPLDVFEPTDGYLFQAVAVLLFGLAWRLAVGRGPLETAV
ncbi:MAG: heparan-alpha-glucosaminide N-acetyltransferase domain-containing protein, partial [Mycobacterium sp.]